MPGLANCPIWGPQFSDAVVTQGNGDFATYRSERTGGEFELTRSAAAAIGNLNQHDRAKLTTWLVDQRRLGTSRPRITTQEIETARQRSRHTTLERLDRMLLFAASKSALVGTALFGPVWRKANLPAAAAWTECVELGEVDGLVRLMADMELFVLRENGSYEIGPKGYQKLDAMRAGGMTSKQGFVAMWFDNSMQSAYAQGIEPAVREAGFDAMRIDQKEHNNKIDDEIIAEIRRSRFVVADFTCGTVSRVDGAGNKPGESVGVARGGVYYEAGFAHGLGLPVIWTCHSEAFKFVHFDTRQYAHIVWEKPDDLRKQLKDRILATIGQGPNLG